MTALTLCRTVEETGAVLLAGGASFRLFARRGPAPQADRWLEAGSLGAVGLAGCVRLWLTTAEMAGETPGAALLRGILVDTRFGHVWVIRMLALALTGILLATRRWQHPGMGNWAGWLSAGVVLGIPQWVGHAGASAHWVWLLPVNVLHVLAAGLWPGGLPFLAVALSLAGRRRDAIFLTVETTRRFSRGSSWAVGTLACTGLLNSWGLVGTFAALTQFFYGRLLLLKITIFSGMVMLGAINRWLVGRWSPATEPPPVTVHALWRNVVLECALGVLVLAASEWLALSMPPR